MSLNKLFYLLITALLMLSLAACSEEAPEEPAGSTASTTAGTRYTGAALSVEEAYSSFDKNADETAAAVAVTLADSGITVNGTGAAASGSVLTVTEAGTYRLSGTLTNGQIRVEVAKTDKVRLILDGVNITCQSGAPLYILSADKAVITLAQGSENSLTDSKFYTLNTEGDPNACLFSKDDLTINGTGALTVKAVYNNGIASKNDLKIVSGRITVDAVNNGLKGKDSVCILNGTVAVSAEDGIKADNETEAGRGYIRIDGGTVTVKASDDALQAITSVAVTGGKVTASAGGKDVNCDGTVNVDDSCWETK